MVLVYGENFIDVGDPAIWKSLYSTVKVNLSSKCDSIPMAMAFLEKHECSSEECLDTAREINLMRDMLSNIPPENAIYDIDNPHEEAPWKNNINPIITSCAHLYTTADGEDLLYQIVKGLTYADAMGVPVFESK